MRVVFDTSLIISMLLSKRGSEAWITHLWSNREFEVIACPALFDELLDVLDRPHISPKVDYQRRLVLFRRFRSDAVWTAGSTVVSGDLPDPDDEFLLSAALETGARFIVTWDKALLQQKEARGVKIIDPEIFISLIIRKRS